MRFIAVHKASSYLMVATSLLALIVSGELHPIASALTFVGLLISWFWEPPRIEFKRFEFIWNGLTLLVLAKTLFDVISGGSIIISGVYFIVFLAINKLFNRRNSRDMLQLYVVSFLHMVAATALNSDLSYGFLFLLYITFTTWTLILFHLKREMEENFLLKYGDSSLKGRPVQVQRVLNSRKLVGSKFLAVTSLISLMVFCGSAAVFFLFPRIGFGFFFKKQRAGIIMAGFSDQIELGQFGVIKTDPTVVMRVEFPKPNHRGRLPHYWRGIAFDHYDGTRWTKSDQKRQRVRPQGGVHHISRRQGSEQITQSIYLEPMETQILFGLSHLNGISLKRTAPKLKLPGRHRNIEIDAEGDVYYDQNDAIAFRYDALSEPEIIPPQFHEQPLKTFRKTVQNHKLQRYLQYPASLDPRIKATAERVIGDAETINEAIDRIQRYLRSEFTYSLKLERNPELSPLADFLFFQRRGHCEYFSTAMIIMLRTQGIPARNVNGFLGGHWNSYGKYLAISQGDAHSWVEVWLGPQTWMTRDPTPAGGPRPPQTGLFATIRQYTDAMRMRWYKYIIEYDLQAQVGLFSRLRRSWSNTFGGRKKTKKNNGRASTRPWAIGILIIAFLGVSILVIRRRQPTQYRQKNRLYSEASSLLEALIDAYTRLGFSRTPSTTAREFLALLQRREAPNLELAKLVITRYEAVRFAGEKFPPDERRALLSQIRSLKRSRS